LLTAVAFLLSITHVIIADCPIPRDNFKKRPVGTPVAPRIHGIMRLDSYQTENFYDEMFEPDGHPRSRTARLAERLLSLSDGELERRQTAADLTLLNMGITFSVYGHSAGTEKVWPFDIIPRIVELDEWNRIERGLKQRITALNLFIDDVYDKARILKDKVVPEELLHSAKCFLDPCAGLKPPKGIWCHITGTDLVRDGDGAFSKTAK
jgi:uncharacterized circularly permuted ATP-grasp superfamily protein